MLCFYIGNSQVLESQEKISFIWHFTGLVSILTTHDLKWARLVILNICKVSKYLQV